MPAWSRRGAEVAGAAVVGGALMDDAGVLVDGAGVVVVTAGADDEEAGADDEAPPAATLLPDPHAASAAHAARRTVPTLTVCSTCAPAPRVTRRPAAGRPRPMRRGCQARA